MKAIHRVLALLPALYLSAAQSAGPRPDQAPADAAIRINVNLVQVDAVVTDFRGRRITDLSASDFEVRQDGRLETIANFSYVPARPDAATAPKTRAAQTKAAKGEVPPPSVFHAAEVRRVLAFVVDDLGLAGENIPSVRNAIRSFIDEQMRPGDLIAIIRTGAGMGALQQFTTDKRLLYAALERVKYGESRVGMSSFAPLGSGVRGGAALEHFREQTLAAGSLGALRFVVNAMREFPGRKSVVLFTENIRLIFRGTTDETVGYAVQQLTDAANRASVVIHAIDPRGMPDFDLTPADNTAGMSRRRVSRVPQQREENYVRTEEGMFALSEATGGLFLHDTNDLAGALRKAADDGEGYYLIGYHPDAGTFESSNSQPKFHRIEVKAKRGGLHVRSRDGFFGEPGANQPLGHTREAQIVHALQSPFSAGAIHPRLTAIFSNDEKSGSFITALLYLDRGELKWSGAADGVRAASVDVAAAAFDENGLALAPVDTTFSLRLKTAEFDEAVKQGSVYRIQIPVSRPGPYVVRAAVRDAANEDAGSAQQYLEVPDIANGRMALSGVVLQAALPASQPPPPAGRESHESNDAAAGDTTGGAARRSYRRGARLMYAYEIFNAAHEALETQARLFHEGEQIAFAKTTLAPLPASSGTGRVTAQGILPLDPNLAPGDYALQVIVTDKSAASKFRTVTQFTDFEIEP